MWCVQRAKMSSFGIGWDFDSSEIIRRYHRKKKIEANNTVAQNFNPP